MVFCTAQDIARRRNKKYARMQILSEDAKVERSYFCYQIKKFYNHKSGYFGCGWSKNKTEWTPFIHAPYFERNSVAILKTKDKKLYEDIYDTVVHGKVHPDIRVVELKDHTHPIRLSTPADEDCYSVIYVGKKINAEDERVIFGEYTGYVASNREMNQETHQYTFALTFNKKVFNEKSNVLFVNEVPSDEEQDNDTHEKEGEEGQVQEKKKKKKKRQRHGRSEEEETAEEELESKAHKKMENGTKLEGKGYNLEITGTNKEGKGKRASNEEKTKQNDSHAKRIILPDDYTYAVDSSIMFNEMSLVNHYKTCDLFYEHDFRINSEWQLVYIDGWPHIILTSIPGIEVFPGEELFADFGFEWFEKVNEICLSNFVKDLYEHRLYQLKMKFGEGEREEDDEEEEDNNIKGLSDVVEKYDLLKCSTTCNICMYNISMNGYDNVVCSGCNNTYHLECVHKTFNDLNSNYEWFCPFCIQFTLKITESREYQTFAQRERQRKMGTTHVCSNVCRINSNGSSNNSTIGSSYTSGSTFADRLCFDKWCQGDLKGMFRGTKSVDELLKIQCVIDELRRCKREVAKIIKEKTAELKMLFVEEPFSIKEFPKGEVFMLQDKGEVQIEPLQFNKLSERQKERDLKCILANYINRVDEFLLKKEKLYCLLNSEVTRKRLKVSKHKLKLLMQSKSDVEDFLKEENQFKEMLELSEKCENILNIENREQIQQVSQEDIPGNNSPSGISEKSEVGQSEILSVTTGSSSFENILHNKYNYVYEKLKEMRTEDKKCFKNAMKLSKRYLGFPLLTEFESGLSTKEPSLPLSDNLKNLRVCSNCYKAHKDIAQAIICRITKMHFQPNFDECASDGNLFKSSSECVQLVIRELANTLRAYRKRELCGIFPPKENARVHIMEPTNSAEDNQMISANNEVNKGTTSIFSLCDKNGGNGKLQEQKQRNIGKNSSLQSHVRMIEYVKEQKLSERLESTSMKQESRTKSEKQKDVKTSNTISAYELKGKYDLLKKGDDDNKSSDENSSDDSNYDSQKKKKIMFLNDNISNSSSDENEKDDKKNSETNYGNGVDKKEKKEKYGDEHIGKTERKNNFIPLIGVELGKTKFQREFTDGVYVGTVTEQIKDEHGDSYFVVTYEDGDVEWITPSFLFRELLKQSTNDIEYPLSTQFKELFHHDFQNDAELKNYSIELKLEKKKKKSTDFTSKNKDVAINERNNSNVNKHKSVTRGVSSKRKGGTCETNYNKKSSSVGNLKNVDENKPETCRDENSGGRGSKRRKTTNIM